MTILSERLALIISADNRGAVRGLSEVGRASRTHLGRAESDIKKFTDGFRKAAPYVGVAASAIAAGLVAAGNAASELSSAQGALDATFGSSSAAMRVFAADAERLGLSEAKASQVAARLGAGLQGLGFSSADAATEVQKLTERASDMAVGFGTSEQALNAISALLRGERDPIEQYGVAIKQADVNARVAAKGLSELEGEAKKNAEAVASLELLYEATASRVGLYGSEANKAAREQAELSAKLENLKAEIGQGVLPVMTQFVEALSTTIDVGRSVAAVIGDIGIAARDAADDVGGLTGLLPAWAQGTADVITGAVSEIAGAISDVDESDFVLLDPAQAELLKNVPPEARKAFVKLGDAVTWVAGLLDRATASATDFGEEVTAEYNSLFDEIFGYQDALAGIDDASAKVAQAHRAHADAMRDASDAAADVRQAQLDVAEAAIIAFDATEAARQGIADYADEQRAATDPVFAMIRALERQEELLKQASGVAIEREGTSLTASGNKPTLLQLAEGASDVESAALGLAGALKVGDTSIEKVRASLRKWVQQGLLTESQAAKLGSTFETVAARATDLEGATVDHAAASGVAEARLEAEEEAAERVRTAQERLTTAQERLVTAQERVSDTADDLSRSHQDSARKAEALDRAMFDLNQEVNKNPQLLGAALTKLDEWVQRGLIPAEEKTRIVRDMLQGINAAVEMFGGSKQLHIEVTSNALDFLNYLATNPTIEAGSIALRDRLAGQYGGYSGATGGRVPGPMGQPRMITAHGGELLSSNMDLARFAQSTVKTNGAPLVNIEQMVVPDAATGIRESMGEAKAAAYRAGLG